MPQSDTRQHTTLADDGWPLSLRRYPPLVARPGAMPVLLQHGLGTSGLQFDLPVAHPSQPVPSLARWLSARGHDVWVCDLRGGGDSALPGRSGRHRWDWSVDDHLLHDMPAFVRYILAHSQAPQLHWVGHSMGGILLLAYCALHGSSDLASGIAAAAALDYSASSSRYEFVVPLRRLGRLVRRVPAGALSRLLAPLAGRINSPLEASFYHPPNMAPEAARAVAANQHDLSGELLYQLATLFAPGGLLSHDGRRRYSDLASAVRTPILFLGGERDLQCAPFVIDRARASLQGAHHAVQFFGKSHGHAEHYGHFDLFSGVRAESEVFPHVQCWLDRHDRAEP